MEQFKRLLRKLFFPKPWMTLLSIPVAAVLLIYTFAGGHKEDWIAILAYVFSAYSLSLVCARVGLLAGHAKEDVQLIIDKVPLAHRYFSDVSFKLHISLYLSLGLNVIYAVMKFTFGLRYHSVWFGTLAVYYFLLAVMRFLLLHHANRKGFGTDRIGELQSYRLCGMILMVMNISLTDVVVIVIRKNEGFQYAGYLIYIMAMYVFYNIITAVMNVTAQICECAVQFEELWEKKNIDFEADLEDRVMLEADAGLLELVWTNLLSNAMKFTPEGGTIRLSQSSDETNVTVCVSDTGCGMTPETMKHIFDKFYQGDTSHATEGNGLGLPLVQRILQLSDGTISVQSKPGEGSTFTVVLPKKQGGQS